MLRRWRSTSAAASSLTQGNWTIAAFAVGVLTVGSLAIPQSPLHHWVAHWLAPSGIPSGTIATPSQVLESQCQPEHFAGTTGTATLTFLQPEPLQGVGLGECGDPYNQSVVAQGIRASGGGWIPLATGTLPWDGYVWLTWSPMSLTALRITVTQSTPDAQIGAVRVRWASLLP